MKRSKIDFFTTFDGKVWIRKDQLLDVLKDIENTDNTLIGSISLMNMGRKSAISKLRKVLDACKRKQERQA